MPIYDYRCESCRSVYDVYHKTREVAEDIVCPTCGSKNAKKLMSIPAAVMPVGSTSSASSDSCDSPGGCCGGACASRN